MSEQIDIKNPDHVTIITKHDSIFFSVKKTEDGVTQEFGFNFPKGEMLPKLDKSQVLIKKVKKRKSI
tara:strand:+ start:100 stop:300 length:201 start_codon:yes stop_codon:yes gene_type:complete